VFHWLHDMYLIQIKYEHVTHRRSLSARAGMTSTILRHLCHCRVLLIDPHPWHSRHLLNHVDPPESLLFATNC